MFIQDHPDFVADPSVSTNLLIRVLASRASIADVMKLLNHYNVTTPWMGIYALDIAVANGDQNIITLLLCNGAVVSDRTLHIARTRQYTPGGSKYCASTCYEPTSVEICNQIINLLSSFSNDNRFELGDVSSFGTKVNDLDLPAKPADFKGYQITFPKYYSCTR